MNKNRFHNPAYRMLVALLSVSLLIGPGAGPAYAAQTAARGHPDRVEGDGQAEHRLHAR